MTLLVDGIGWSMEVDGGWWMVEREKKKKWMVEGVFIGSVAQLCTPLFSFARG